MLGPIGITDRQNMEWEGKPCVQAVQAGTVSVDATMENTREE
jgi:hypothetical protein